MSREGHQEETLPRGKSNVWVSQSHLGNKRCGRTSRALWPLSLFLFFLFFVVEEKKHSPCQLLSTELGNIPLSGCLAAGGVEKIRTDGREEMDLIKYQEMSCRWLRWCI